MPIPESQLPSGLHSPAGGQVPEVVESAIRIGAKAVWMQQGIYHEEAAQKARDAGLEVVMDSCILQVHQSLGA